MLTISSYFGRIVPRFIVGCLRTFNPVFAAAALSSVLLAAPRSSSASCVLNSRPLNEEIATALESQSQDRLLDLIGRTHFEYFRVNQGALSGLTLDRSSSGSPASIAAVGFALTAYPCAVERGWIEREEATAYALKVLRFLSSLPQGEGADCSGQFGFFYHFLDADTGKRYRESEISTIDTALLMAGVLFSREYFDGTDEAETEIRALAKSLYERVEWDRAVNEAGLVSHGWYPDKGKIPFSWKGLDEGVILIILGMGSPTHPLPADSWARYMETSSAVELYGHKHLPFGPLFGHQYPQCWLDLRDIADFKSRELGFTYFENSRRAALVQQRYAIENPKKWRGFSALDWGLTACDGPGWKEVLHQDQLVLFFPYVARGYPAYTDDGTIAPTAVAASLPFAPEIVVPTLRHWLQSRPEIFGDCGFFDSFNPSFDPQSPSGWIASDRLGIDQGPIVLMTENHRSSFVWKTMRKSSSVRRGLEKSGFSGGWLGPFQASEDAQKSGQEPKATAGKR